MLALGKIKGGAVVRALASHQCGPGSNPGVDTICGLIFTAARLAQLGKCRSAERKAVGSNPGRTNTQGL